MPVAMLQACMSQIFLNNEPVRDCYQFVNRAP